MIYRIFESKFAFVITACALTAMMWNYTTPNTGLSIAGNGTFVPVVIAHGPTLPPDPWAGSTENLTHGPTLPPDPWAGTENIAHGPTLPPDPWAGSTENLTHGPTLPPDPWAGTENLA